MFNKVILMGRIVADIDLRMSAAGLPFARFRIATDRRAKQGEERQSDFFNVTVFGTRAEFVSRYFSKGKLIIVDGSIQNDNYTDNAGVKHYTCTIIANDVTFGETKASSMASGGSQPYAGSQPYNPQGQPFNQQAQHFSPPGMDYTQNPPANQQNQNYNQQAQNYSQQNQNSNQQAPNYNQSGSLTQSNPTPEEYSPTAYKGPLPAVDADVMDFGSLDDFEEIISDSSTCPF